MDIKQFVYELGFENHEKTTPLKLCRWNNDAHKFVGSKRTNALRLFAH